MSGEARLSIGQVARTAGIRTSKVRYYESVGLLASARRPSGYRVYPSSVLDTLRVIQFAQDAGFSIADIRHVLAGFDRRTPASERWQRVARRKLEELKAQLERTRRMQAILERLVACECVQLSECTSLCGPSPLATLSRSGR